MVTFSEISHIVRKVTGKRGRDAFGYMEPRGDLPDFAQCSSCRLWLIDRDRCHWLPNNFRAEDGDSCAEYVQGPPIRGKAKTTGALTPVEVGFVSGAVRCENCASFDPDGSTCQLYQKLNAAFPDLFSLEEGVLPRACCNAFIGG